MEYLTPAQVLFIQARLVAETGGGAGLRDLGLLEAALARPRATFDGALLYPDLPTQAAALMQSLVQGHPLVDSNKRVGITAAALFLRRNGVRLTATGDELETFTLRVARGEVRVDAIAAWFRTHTTLGPARVTLPPVPRLTWLAEPRLFRRPGRAPCPTARYSGTYAH